MTRKKLSLQFEGEVKDFLSRLKFDDVEGAKDTFRIGGIQVDACGGFENTLLVVECCMAVDLKEKPLRSKIKEFRGASYTIEKGVKSHPVYGKYGQVRYVLATKNIEVRREDIQFANAERPRMYIWDENFRQYYDDLFKKIEHFAKFNLLGEMGIRPSQQNPISVPAFMTTISGKRMFTFVMNPKDLLEISYVARRETRNERYYQRILKKDRIEKIAGYVDDGNILPNNLIIAFNENFRKFLKFHVIKEGGKFSLTDWPYKDVSYGILEFPKDYRTCWIIDGQHRLYSFVRSKTEFPVPVAAFDNLPLQDQCKIFLDINKYQKPVPPDLIWDLNGDMLHSKEEGIISNAVKFINANGPLRHRVYIPSTGVKSKRDLLRMSGLCISIENAGLARQITVSKTANPFFDDEPGKTVQKLGEGLIEYFKCVMNRFKSDWDLGGKGFTLSNAGNAIMINFLERIIRKVVLSGKDIPNMLDYIKYLDPLAMTFQERYNDPKALKQLKLRITSEGGKRLFLQEVVTFAARQLNDPEFAGGMELPSIERIRELEAKLKNVIKMSLSKGESGDWFKTKAEAVDPQMYCRALKHMTTQGITDQSQAHLHLTFGDCIALVGKYDNAFKGVLWRSGKEFSERSESEVALRHIGKVRARYAHAVGSDMKPYDWELFEIYMKKMSNCLDSALGKGSPAS